MTLFFFSNKKFIYHALSATIWQKNNFLVEVTFKFFGVFRGYKMGTLARNGFKVSTWKR